MEDATMVNIKRIEAMHNEFSARIKNHPKLKTIRQTGTILAIEWQTGDDTSYFNSLRDTLYLYFLEAGIILRPLGNIIYILPPYCISNSDLAYIYDKIEQALNEL
jgi:adenosylmethionine-8-amino-7-oxononanoate aminotransferase